MSAETRARGSPSPRDSTILNSRSRRGSTGSVLIDSTAASGGASAGSRTRNSSTAARLALDLELHPALVVEHPTGQLELLGETEDEGTKPDPLDDADDPGVDPAAGARPWRGGHRYGPASSISSRSTW